MKIILLSRFYPFVGGREVIVENLATALGRNHEVHVLTPDAGKVLTEHYHLHDNLGPKKTLRLIEEIRPDVINAHAFYLLTQPVVELAEELGVPTILTLHGDLLNYGTKKEIQHFETIAPRIKRIVTVCDYGRNVLIENGVGQEKVAVIPNGIPIERFSLGVAKNDLRQGFDLPSRTFLYLVPARFTKKKGLAFLLDAVAQCNAEEMVFVLSAPASRTSESDKKYASSIWNLAKAKGVNDRLRVILTDPSAMPFLFNAVDGMVLPSQTEQLPLAIIEAMAAGTPVIATDVGGISELINNHVTGLLVEYGNTHKLARALESVISDINARNKLARNAYQVANKKYKVSTMADAYLKQYRACS